MEAGFFIALVRPKKQQTRQRKAKHCEQKETDVLMMSPGTKRKMARESRGSPPVGSAQRSPTSAPDKFGLNLHFKGFAGGVPQNTERTTVKPWVGIAR
jgi:hypothetical protein